MDTAALSEIYRSAIAQCSPENLVARHAAAIGAESSVNVVALGKCATSLYSAIVKRFDVADALVIVPEGYGDLSPESRLKVLHTSHPALSAASFEAGAELVKFVGETSHEILFAISGGGSAAVELELEPHFTRDELIHVNGVITSRGLPIEKINVVRKHLSAIKGGRLATLAGKKITSLLLSDVPPGRLDLIASGPTLSDSSSNEEAATILDELGDPLCSSIAARLRDRKVPDTPKSYASRAILLADNSTVVEAAADAARQRSLRVQRLPEEISGDASLVADRLVDIALATEALVVAGGETTVDVPGNGRGGRTFVMAAHVAKRCLSEGVELRALFGSSDGLDGNSGAAGVVFDSRRARESGITLETIDRALSESDSFSLVPQLGEAIMTGATGNNLRDIFLLARH